MTSKEARAASGSGQGERQKVWFCKIGEVDPANVPNGADFPMREAIERTYKRITGEDPTFLFSGWGAELTEIERAVVEDRLPDSHKAASEHLALAAKAMGEEEREELEARIARELEAAFPYVLGHFPGPVSASFASRCLTALLGPAVQGEA
jgi:hypothetical protein